MRTAGRNIEEYSYGYNGMEKDNEVSGNGNSYTTQFRQYDSRLGRWKSRDIITHYSVSPYYAMDNNPILIKDPRGADGVAPNGTMNATIYFIADPASGLSDIQMYNYVMNFKASISSVWLNYVFDGKAFNLDDVSFVIVKDASEVDNECQYINIITVGNGESLDPESPEAREKISHVYGPKNNKGYFFYTSGSVINYAAHEFGHVFGLSDRYHEVYYVNTDAGPTGAHDQEHNMLSGRSTVPMHQNTRGLNKEPDYRPLNNLMSGTGGALTRKQLQIVIADQFEKDYPTITFISNPNNPQPYSQGLVKGTKVRAYDNSGSEINNAWYVDNKGSYFPKGNMMDDLFYLGLPDPTKNKRRERNNKITDKKPKRGTQPKY